MNQGADGGCWCEGGRDLGRGVEGCSQHTEFAKVSLDQSGEEAGHFRNLFSSTLGLSEMKLRDLKKTGNVCGRVIVHLFPVYGSQKETFIMTVCSVGANRKPLDRQNGLCLANFSAHLILLFPILCMLVTLLYGLKNSMPACNSLCHSLPRSHTFLQHCSLTGALYPV